MKRYAAVPLLALSLLVGADSPVGTATEPAGPEPAADLLIVDPVLVDGTGSRARAVAALVVDGGRIDRIVERGSSEPIPNARREVDAEGLFAIPGLWDMHVHLADAREPALPLLLVHGVTGIRDMGGDLTELRAWRERTRDGRLPGPRIRFSGPMLESPAHMEGARERGVSAAKLRNHWPVGDVAEARAAVERLAESGADFVKGRSYASPEVFHAIADAAREAGLDFVGHPPWELPPAEAARAGMDSFEHGFYPWPPDALDDAKRRELVDALVANGTGLVPTLVSWERRTVPFARTEALVEDAVGLLDLRRRFVAPALVASWRQGLENRRREGREQGWREVLDRHAAEIGRFHREGVRVLPGSDLAGTLVYPGSSLHEELALFVEKAGMTPMEALQSATRDAAELLHLGDVLGTIEKGKQADIVLLGADPLADIRNLAAVRGVVSRGRYYDPEKLSALLDEVRAAVR